MFFKHKYITQPTVTPADAIVKAYHDLISAINGIKNTKRNSHLEALEWIQNNLVPGNERTIKVRNSHRPRVERNIEQQELTVSQPPRVRFADALGIHQAPTRMIVALPKEPVVTSP